MQSKDIISLPLGTKFVAMRFGYTAQRGIEPAQVNVSHTEVVTLLSHQRFQPNGHTSTTPDSNQFVTTSERNFGYLATDGTYYRVVKPAEILGEYEAMKPAREAELARQAQEQAEREARQKQAQQVRLIADTQAEQLSNNIKSAISLFDKSLASNLSVSLYGTTKSIKKELPGGDFEFQDVPSVRGSIGLDADHVYTFIELLMKAQEGIEALS